MPVVITIDECFADEFNCEKFWIFTEDEVKRYNITAIINGEGIPYAEDGEDKVSNPVWEGEHYFGTNQSLVFETIEDWQRQFKIRSISQEEYEFLKGLLGEEFGTGPNYFS